jgi:hypothetical protein
MVFPPELLFLNAGLLGFRKPDRRRASRADQPARRPSPPRRPTGAFRSLKMRVLAPTTVGSPLAGYLKRLLKQLAISARANAHLQESNICFDDAVCFDAASTAIDLAPLRRFRFHPIGGGAK